MFYKINLTGLLLITLSYSCSKKDPQLSHVMALQQMNDLATVEYIVTKIIKANERNATATSRDAKFHGNGD